MAEQFLRASTHGADSAGGIDNYLGGELAFEDRSQPITFEREPRGASTIGQRGGGKFPATFEAFDVSVCVRHRSEPGDERPHWLE